MGSMPNPTRTYCYKTTDGEVFDREYPAGEAPEGILIDAGPDDLRAIPHRAATRDRQAEAAGIHVSVAGSGNQTRRPNNTWPMDPCFASGVHPDQAQDLRDHLRGNGLSVEVTKNGDPIYTSASQRRKALKCRGMHDQNSFD